MTKQELLDKLNQQADISAKDPEYAHPEADKLLLEYIDDKEITFAFEGVRKWYA